MAKTKAKARNHKKRFVSFIGVVVVIAILIAGANLLAVQNLVKKGNSYPKPEYENQLVPQKDENGYWYFTFSVSLKSFSTNSFQPSAISTRGIWKKARVFTVP